MAGGDQLSVGPVPTFTCAVKASAPPTRGACGGVTTGPASAGAASSGSTRTIAPLQVSVPPEGFGIATRTVVRTSRYSTYGGGRTRPKVSASTVRSAVPAGADTDRRSTAADPVNGMESGPHGAAHGLATTARRWPTVPVGLTCAAWAAYAAIGQAAPSWPVAAGSASVIASV